MSLDLELHGFNLTYCEYYFVILNVLCKDLFLYDIPPNGYAIISNHYLYFVNVRFSIVSLF